MCAAELDAAEALYQLILCCEMHLAGAVLRGRSTPAYACEQMQRAVELGLAKAQYTMGMYCAAGYGCELSPEKAAAWYRRVAEQGTRLPALSWPVCMLPVWACRSQHLRR